MQNSPKRDVSGEDTASEFDVLSIENKQSKKITYFSSCGLTIEPMNNIVPVSSSVIVMKNGRLTSM